jgi:hypothetical protein
MILNEFFNNPDLAEGAEFGAYYSEQVAQQIFDQRQDISSEDEVLNQAYHIVANDQGQKSARYMFNYDADFPSDVVSNYFHLQKQGVAEAGPYGSRNPDTMSPGDYDRYQQDQMDQSKRDFKRQEHDAEWEQEKAYSAKLAAQQAGPWYIRLNGKLLRDKTGNPYTFNSKAAANKAALTMQAKLFNQGKEFMLTTNPNDPQQGVAEEKVRLDPKCWTGKKIGNPKTKMKGGVRVNNCVPAESVEEAQEKNKLDEVSTELLARYKTGAAADAKKADAAGDYKRSDKRFSGIVKATNKQFANDLKKHSDMAEASQRVDSLVTDALKIMRGSELSDAVAALKTVLGDREYNSRRGHYNFYVRQLMDMYSQQGVAEADMSRRGFLKGLGAAAMAGAAGGAMAQSNQQQDLGNGFVLTTIDVAGHTVKAVLDTQSGLSFTLNRGSNGSAIIRSQARFLTIKDGKIVDASMSVGPATTNAMKKAGLVQEGVAEGLDDNVPADRGEYDQEGEMAQQDLTTAVDAAEELRSILSADENLPEWVQAKITKAVDYLDTTRDYMKSKEPELNESRLHRLNLLKTIMIQTP